MNLTAFCHRHLLPVAAATSLACVANRAETQRPTEATLASSGTDSVRVKRFLAELQSAISRDDSVAVSQLFQYPPLGVWDGHRMISLQGRQQLLPIYRSVFTTELRRLILAATLDSLWANWQGLTLGRGRIWFQINKHGDPRIAAINGRIVRDTTPQPPAKTRPNEEW